MKFSFVIPAYKNYTDLHQLLFDIYKNCSQPHEILILDDNSNDKETLDGLAWWTSNGMLPIQHIRNVENLGFLKNSNKGLKMATGDILCLISTDVRIHKDIVKFSDAINSNELIGGRYLDWDTGWNTFNGKTFPYIEGWLLCASKDFWKEVDYFDERYSPNDMEDIDISTKVLEVSGVLRVFPSEYVEHGGAHSIGYTPEREELTKRNKKKFEEKWIMK